MPLPWYEEGLRFKCTECGQCCTGFPGYTWVTEEEIHAMAKYLKMSTRKFRKHYLRQVGNRFSLLENPKNYDCVFLEGKKCTIYPVRPTQCRTFPWWPQNLKSQKDWEDAKEYCEGIRDDAPVVPYSTIKKQVAIQENDGCFE